MSGSPATKLSDSSVGASIGEQKAIGARSSTLVSLRTVAGGTVGKPYTFAIPRLMQEAMRWTYRLQS